MTETTVTKITTIKDGKDLPGADSLQCYHLSQGETTKTAIEKFEKYYRVTPERGYLWGLYLYLEKP